MSLVLDHPDTAPKGLEIKTWGSDVDPVRLGQYRIAQEDFLAAAWYVLTNTNLRGRRDPRLDFIRRVKRLAVQQGFPSLTNGRITHGVRLAERKSTPRARKRRGR